MQQLFLALEIGMITAWLKKNYSAILECEAVIQKSQYDYSTRDHILLESHQKRQIQKVVSCASSFK